MKLWKPLNLMMSIMSLTMMVVVLNTQMIRHLLMSRKQLLRRILVWIY